MTVVAGVLLWAGFTTQKPYKWLLIAAGGIAAFSIASLLIAG